VTGSTFFNLEKIPDGGSGGTTQAETRVYNERLVLSLIRRHGQLSKADLTRLTGLAAQTMTTIVNRATENGLLVRREPLRGRLGQPSVPYALTPEGAFAFGLKIDHRSADVVLVDFVGNVVAVERTTFPIPSPREIVSFARSAIARIHRRHRTVAASRIAGLGIASPFYHRDAGGSDGRLAEWKQVDVRAELDSLFDWPVYLFNDGTVSAAAELMFGAGLGRADFLYAYVGNFIGGGLVLDRHLFPGRNKLAGSIGAIPVAGSGAGTLGERASLAALAARARRHADLVFTPDGDWSVLGRDLSAWIDDLVESLVQTTRSAVALIDVDCIVIDGALPPPVRKEIARQLRRGLATAFLDRPEPFTVAEGSFGHLAPAIGGASIPLLVQYSNDKEILFKDDRDAARPA